MVPQIEMSREELHIKVTGMTPRETNVGVAQA